MRNFSDKRRTENQNKHFMFTVFRKSCLFYIRWKNMAEKDNPQMTI